MTQFNFAFVLPFVVVDRAFFHPPSQSFGTKYEPNETKMTSYLSGGLGAAGGAYGGGMYDEVMDPELNEIDQEESWAVIEAYFEEKGLVRQQLDSFDAFVQHTIQEVVSASIPIELFPEPEIDEENPELVTVGDLFLSFVRFVLI